MRHVPEASQITEIPPNPQAQRPHWQALRLPVPHLRAQVREAQQSARPHPPRPRVAGRPAGRDCEGAALGLKEKIIKKTINFIFMTIHVLMIYDLSIIYD